MSVTVAELHESINTAWNAWLDWEFKQYWDESKRDNFPSLHDQEAGQAQPFPYCVFEQELSSAYSRMSGPERFSRYEIHDVPVVFRIYAKQPLFEGGDERSAKQVAAKLAGLVIGRFGGHPTIRPDNIPMQTGEMILTRYQGEYGVRVGDQEYEWTLRYIFRVGWTALTSLKII